MQTVPYYLGCPEWSNRDWKGTLFTQTAQPRDFLRQYAQVFNTVEGNTTFYALPKPEIVQRWKSETPDHFRFCFKFSKILSHQKQLQQIDEDLNLFFQTLAPLEERLGPFFLQLPPNFKGTDLSKLQHFLSKLPSEFQYAVEVRHLDFFDHASNEQRLNELLHHHGVNRVCFDTTELHRAKVDTTEVLDAQRRKPKIPRRMIALGKHPFIRFVGHPTNALNHHTLQEWAQVLGRWIKEGRSPFMFIHTPDDCFAPELARDFHQFLSEHHPLHPLPLWPREQTSHNEGPQLSLF